MSTRLTNPMFLIFQIIILVISVYRVRTKVRTVLQDIKLNTGTRYLNDFSFKKKKKKKIILTTSSVTQADSQQNSALDWISVWHWSWLTPGMLWWRFSFSNLRTAWSASSWGWYTYSDFFFFFLLFWLRNRMVSAPNTCFQFVQCNVESYTVVNLSPYLFTWYCGQKAANAPFNLDSG